MDVVSSRLPKHRTLASRFSLFIGLLLVWVVMVVLAWDIHTHTFRWGEGILLATLIMAVAVIISRFTIKILTRPLALLQQGITSVREGKFEPIQVSKTDDEIEDLGDSFNSMIEDAQRTNVKSARHRDLLEERIRQRMKSWKTRCGPRSPRARRRATSWPTCRTSCARL